MNLTLTFDYELFGDGSGNIFTHIIEPMDYILKRCNKYNIKITIYFEALEYIKLRDEWLKGNTMGYKKNPIKAIVNQIQQAVKDGHDIQLHIHPQWFDAYFKNEKWVVDMNNWRLGDFKGNDIYGLLDLVADCKNELEKLIRSVNPEYLSIGFRAGGYNIMPSYEIYSVLVALGFKYDSSVFPGGHENTNLSKYDYRNLDNKLDFWWADLNDHKQPALQVSNIMEIPIFSLTVQRWQRILTWNKIKSLLIKSKQSMSSLAKEKIENKSLWRKITFMFQDEVVTWDVCMFSKRLHKKTLKRIKSNYLSERNNFVLIGHPKSLSQPKLFDNFLKLVTNKKHSITFKTLSELHESFV